MKQMASKNNEMFWNKDKSLLRMSKKHSHWKKNLNTICMTNVTNFQAVEEHAKALTSNDFSDNDAICTLMCTFLLLETLYRLVIYMFLLSE